MSENSITKSLYAGSTIRNNKDLGLNYGDFERRMRALGAYMVAGKMPMLQVWHLDDVTVRYHFQETAMSDVVEVMAFGERERISDLEAKLKTQFRF